MGDVVIVAYRPKPGREADLLALVKDHVPFLRRLDLATDRTPVLMRNRDGVVVEVFEWKPGAIARAHADPRIHDLWARYDEVCEYVPLKDLPETAQLFAQFTPLD